MNIEPISLGIGLFLGLMVGLATYRRRTKGSANDGIRDYKTRLHSLNLRLERSQTELAATKSLVAKLLDERNRARDNGERVTQSPLVVVLDDPDPHQLSSVKGIGPKLAVTLASYGITDLEKLAEVNETDLALIEATAPNLAERLVRERWKEQAIVLVNNPKPIPGQLGSTRAASKTGDIVEPEGPDPDFSWSRFRNGGQERSLNGS